MDLSDLQIFRAVVQAGGITRAAEKLNRVQSNITTRVQQLEQDLGVELFIRNGKKLHLSPAGKLLLDYADRLLDLAEEAREAVHDAKPRGLLRLGSMESTASMRLPVPMNAYLSRYPEVTLEEVRTLAPSLVLLPSEPYVFADRHIPEVGAALPDARVVLVDGRDLFWWGSRTPAAAARLDQVLFGDAGRAEGA